MFCIKCGNEIRPNAKFCAKCGTPVPAPDEDQKKESAASDNSQSLEELLNLAVRYGDSGDYAQQLMILQHVATLYPDVSGVYNLMGIAHRNLGDHHKAIECYKRASELDPDNGVFLSNTAIALVCGGNPVESLGWFEKALPMLKKGNNASYPSALGNYALALAQAGYPDNAARCLKEAAKLGYVNADEMRKRLEELGIYYH